MHGHAEGGSEHARKLEIAAKLGYDCVVSNQDLTGSVTVQELE